MQRMTDELVGVHVVTPRAAEVIPEATLAVTFGLAVDDIIDTDDRFPITGRRSNAPVRHSIEISPRRVAASNNGPSADCLGAAPG